jgi:hypothetical protein
VPGLIRTVTAGDLRRGGELVSNLAVVTEVERLARPTQGNHLRRDVCLFD